MSTDPNTPLFEISNGDDVTYEDDPAVIQARENLTVAECIQQEKAEQKGLEREERRVWEEVEKLKGDWPRRGTVLRQRSDLRSSMGCSCMEQREWQSGGGWHWWRHHLPKLAQVGHHLGNPRGV